MKSEEMTAAFPLFISGANADENEDNVLAIKARTDREAFAALYRKYVDSIYRYHFIKTNNNHTAEELTSQTFLAALESINSFKGTGKFRSWLMGIAARKLADHYRKSSRLVLVSEHKEIPKMEDLPDEDHQSKISILKKFINQLPKDRAEALSLRIFAGLSIDDIAGSMSRSQSAVRMLLSRGVRDLRKKMGNYHEK